MDVVGVSTYYYGLAFQIFANSTEVAMKFFLVWRMNERFSILCAEHYVYVVFY